MLSTYCEGINIFELLKNSKLSGKHKNAACFIQPVMTSLWGFGVGIPVMKIEILKKEHDLLLHPIRIK